MIDRGQGRASAPPPRRKPSNDLLLNMANPARSVVAPEVKPIATVFGRPDEEIDARDAHASAAHPCGDHVCSAAVPTHRAKDLDRNAGATASVRFPTESRYEGGLPDPWTGPR